MHYITRRNLWQEQLKTAKAHLSHMKTYYEDNEISDEERKFSARIPELFDDWDRLIPLVEQHRFFR